MQDDAGLSDDVVCLLLAANLSIATTTSSKSVSMGVPEAIQNRRRNDDTKRKKYEEKLRSRIKVVISEISRKEKMTSKWCEESKTKNKKTDANKITATRLDDLAKLFGPYHVPRRAR